MGDCRQGNAPYIQKDLKIKAHINCSDKSDDIFPEEGGQLLTIPVADSPGKVSVASGSQRFIEF